MKILPPPGPGRTRQLALLGVLLVAAAYALWRVLGPQPGWPASAGVQSPGAADGARGARSRTRGRAAKGDAAARAARTSWSRCRKSRRRRVIRSGSGSSRRLRRRLHRRTCRRRQPPGPPPPPPVPPIPLKFIGRVVMPDKRVVASLSDGKGNVLRGTEGQVIDGRYRVVRIGEESIVMEYVNGTGRQTLPLRGS